MNIKGWMTGVIGMLLVIGLSSVTMAQNQGGRGQQGGGFNQQGQQGRGQGGFNQQNFDPAELQRTIRQTRADAIREQLGSSEEEWAVLGPKIEKINGLVADTNSGMSGMMNLFGRRAGGAGRGRGGFAALNITTLMGGSNAMAQRMSDLQDAIDNPAMPESEIKSRLAAVRAERERIRQELAAARADLIPLLTQRQEAILFTMGVLE